jgi:argininosuccinate lyase
LREREIAARLDQGFLDATTLMEYLIARGVPQRTAHEVIGRLVALCEERRCRLVDLADDDLRAAHPQLGPEARSALGIQNAMKAFASYGSTAPVEVARQIADWASRLRSFARRD